MFYLPVPERGIQDDGNDLESNKLQASAQCFSLEHLLGETCGFPCRHCNQWSSVVCCISVVFQKTVMLYINLYHLNLCHNHGFLVFDFVGWVFFFMFYCFNRCLWEYYTKSYIYPKESPLIGAMTMEPFKRLTKQFEQILKAKPNNVLDEIHSKFRKCWRTAMKI